MNATDATFSPRIPWRDLCVRCALRVSLSAKVGDIGEDAKNVY